MKNSFALFKETRPKKHLSQNFLADPHAKERILSACQLKPNDVVLEIGPGTGALTRDLMTRVEKLYAIEADSDLYKKLKEDITGEHFQLIHADFLKYDLTSLPQGIKVIGNLPYHISTPIIEKLIQMRSRIQHVFLTVQLEFGQRLAAQPHSKDYGALSCFV